MLLDVIKYRYILVFLIRLLEHSYLKELSMYWRITLLVVLLFSMPLYAQIEGAQKSHVKEENIEQSLNKINQLSNVELAIVQLNKLLESNSMPVNLRIDALLMQTKNFIDQSEYNHALAHCQQAITLATQSQLFSQQAQAYKLLGIIYYFQGQYNKVLNAYQTSLNYYQQQPITKVIAIKQANLLNNIGLVQTHLSDSANALKSYQLAEPLYQQYGDEMDKVDIRYNIATLYVSLRHYELAIDMLQEVLTKRVAMADGYGEAKASADLGVSYKYSGKYQLAKQHSLAALHYFQRKKDKFEIASQLHNIAEIYYEQGQMDKAFIYATQGVEISTEIGHKRAMSGTLHTLAKIFFSQGNIEVALENILLSNAIAEQMSYQGLLNENLSFMALIYAAKLKTQQAVKAQLSYQKGRLKLSNEMLNKQLARFESEQLAQQVKNLQQYKKLQDLQATKVEQQQNFIILVILFLFIVVVLVYRQYLEGKSNKELEIRVKQRTEALEFLTEELQNASEIKGQFLANMSHEIRTPLTAVIGQAEAIIYGDFDEGSVVREVEIIHSNSLHLLQLVNDILDLSKIEANKFELDEQQQDLHTIVHELSDMFTEQAQKKGLNFSVSHHLSTPFIINIDGFRLKQILINLCSNAIKFTSEGWVALDIAIVDKNLYFTITDTGIGMNDQQITKIFKSFTQADNSISRRFSGSGLGLFLSKQIAKVMAGNINVSSQLGEGSTFILKLPFGEVCSLMKESTAIVPTKLHPNDSYTGEVLLVDDHDDNRRLIARLLTSLGLNVITASNGKEAIKLCIEHKPTLTLLDIQMPEMDGMETLMKLRELGCTSPIYALTANAMSHEISQYLSLGFDGHLKKPIERDIFIETIAQYYPALKQSQSVLHEVLEKVDMSDLIVSFKSSLTTDKDKILACQDKKQYDDLARLVHKIVGAAKMFGFTELSQSAQELESALKQQKTNLIEDLIYCLVDEMNLVQHYNTVSYY